MIMRYLYAVMMLVCFLGLSACASYGTKVDQEQLSHFVKGKTTYAEVLQALGKPTHSIVNAGGGRTLVYGHAATKTNALSYIPIFGAFIGGFQSKNTAVTFFFGKDSVLTDYTVSENETNMGYGPMGGVGAN
jgi:hypothetical protein